MKKDKEVQWQPRKRCAPPDIDNVNRDWDVLIREASEDAAGLEHA